jgi:hypothetical protein
MEVRQVVDRKHQFVAIGAFAARIVAGTANAGVVDQQVQPGMVSPHAPGQRLHLVERTQVARVVHRAPGTCPGDLAGDLLLMDIASALTSETRAVDLVSRYGGDEFVIVLPDLAVDGFLPVAERVVQAVARVGSERWSRTPVTASVGLTMAKSDDDVASLLRRADAEAYAAKRAGGNRVIVSMPPQLERSGVMVNVDTTDPRASGRPAKRNTGA